MKKETEKEKVKELKENEFRVNPYFGYTQRVILESYFIIRGYVTLSLSELRKQPTEYIYYLKLALQEYDRMNAAKQKERNEEIRRQSRV